MIFFSEKNGKELPRDTQKAIVTTLSTKFWQMAKSFLFIVRKQVEKLKVFLHKRKVFGSISKSLKFFNFSRKPICLRIDCMDHRMQLSQPCLKLFNLMPRKTSFKDGIGWKTYHFSKKSKNVPLDRWIAVLITPPKSLQQMVESFTHNVRKCWEMSCFFWKSFCHQSVPMDESWKDCSLGNPAE